MPANGTIPRICESCGAGLTRRGRKKYCGWACYTARPLPKLPLLNCARCAKLFSRRLSYVAFLNFCSDRCRSRSPLRPRSTVAIDASNGVAYIPLLAKDGSVRCEVIIDAADAVWAGQWRWHLSAGSYAARRLGRTNIYLHRELLGLVSGDGFEGDHINRNKLDNRRVNLRRVPKGTNAQNVPGRRMTSRYRGVCWASNVHAWVAYVCPQGKRKHLGVFKREEDAAEVARLARAELMPYSVD